MASPTAKLAVLIDADNASHNMIGFVLAEIAKYGTAFVKRAYGDWTMPTLGGWKQRLLENSIQPIQQFAYTMGKNSTDSAMIIDAMDLLYSNKFDGFCIISSDSDFTRLASRIRESGLVVYGCGERKTPKPFVTACDKFIYVENLLPRAQTPTVEIAPPNATSNGRPSRALGEPSVARPGPGPSKGKDVLKDTSMSLDELVNKEGGLPNFRCGPAQPSYGELSKPGPGPGPGPSAAGSYNPSSEHPPLTKRKRVNSDAAEDAPSRDRDREISEWSQLIEWLEEAVDGSPGADEDGWVRLADVGQLMQRRHPDFDSRNYNFEKLSDLIRATAAFDYDRRFPTPGRPAIVYVRPKARTRVDAVPLDSHPKGLLSHESQD